jgi:hypothetical protein
MQDADRRYRAMTTAVTTRTSHISPANRNRDSGLASSALAGGRRWWAHVVFTRANIQLTILEKEIEETLRFWREEAKSWGSCAVIWTCGRSSGGGVAAGR